MSGKPKKQPTAPAPLVGLAPPAHNSSPYPRPTGLRVSMDRRCDAVVAAGLRADAVAVSGLSQASPGQGRLCSSMGLGARLCCLS